MKGYSTAWLRCGVLAGLLLSMPLAAAPPTLATVLSELQHAPTSARAELAEIALEELMLAYREEAERARAEARRQPGNADLARWSRAVEAMADDLDSQAINARFARRVDGFIGPDGSLNLHIDGHPVLVTGPRPREQADLERRILARFCATNICGESDFASFSITPAHDHHVASGSGPQPRWRFTQYAGPICETGDGLEFQFSNGDDLWRKRRACSALVAELHDLTAQLAGAEARGIPIDWQDITIRPGAPGGRHRVILNYRGDELHMAVPHLAASPSLVSLLRPWLLARVQGSSHPLVILNADILMPLAQR